MKRKVCLAAFVLAVVLPAAAQDTYESARLLGSDLNGTARYVGMGGAMDALGADLSTISSNPAGIGLFRHSHASISLGFVSQQDAQKFDNKSKTTVSFDQAGFVYSSRISRSSFINFSFNFHKSKNFNQILSAANSFKNLNCSQNGLTYAKGYNEVYDFDVNNQDKAMGYFAFAPRERPRERSWAFSEADFMNANVLNCDVKKHLDDPEANWIYYNDAEAYSFDRAHRGWINNFDFNVSGNVNDRFYWGITVGVKDVNYRGYSEYAETLLNASKSPEGELGKGSVAIGDERRIKGTGVDVTAGVIFRPSEESPFRIGLSVSSPTWYDLTSSNDTYMTKIGNNIAGTYKEEGSLNDYDFKFYTPWKFGLSLGHTIGTQLALGFGYEFSDYTTSTNRVNKSNWYSDYGYSPSYTDESMKDNTNKSMKGVHTLKAGLEYKPVPELGIRFGYNYVSSPYESNGVRDMTLESPGVTYASTTDYVNWKDTHRITCGLGYKVGGINIDLAYQYNTTKGDFHPFQPYRIGDKVVQETDTGVKDVKFNRHQLLLTLGYTF